MTESQPVERDEVEVAHVALIRHWPRVRTWLDKDRTALRLRQDLGQAAAEWERHARDEAWLEHRGPRLVAAEALAGRPGFLNAPERAYVAACTALQERAAVRSRRVRQAVLAASLTVALVASVLAGWAWIERGRAETQQRVAEANAAQAATAEASAEREARLARSRQLAAQSSGLGADQQDLALLLGVEAWRASNTVEARSSLLSALIASRHVTGYLRGQPNILADVTFSPDGQTLASVDLLGNLVFWDVPSGRMLAEAGRAAGHQLDFSPNGKTVVAASRNGALIRLWDARSGALLQELATPEVLAAQQSLNPNFWQGPINNFALSSDGATVAAPGASGTIVLWDMATGRPRVTRQAFDQASPDEAIAFAFSPDGRRVAAAQCMEPALALMVGCEVEEIRVWDLTDDRLPAEPLVLVGTSFKTTGMRFSPNGGRLAATGCTEQDEDGACTAREIRVWDLHDQTRAEPLVLNGVPLDAYGDFGCYGLFCPSGQSAGVFSPDGGTLVSASAQGTVIVWDLEPGEPDGRQIRPAGPPIWAASFSSDGQVLAVGDEDGTVALWDTQTGHWLPGEMEANGGQVRALAFGPDDRTLASGGTDRTIVLLDTLAAEPLARPQTALPGAVDIAMSPDGTTLAAALGAEGVVLLSATTGERLGGFAGAPSSVTTVAFSPDGSTVAGGTDGGVVLWNVDGERQQGGRLEGLPGRVDDLVFSPDSAKLAAGGAIDPNFGGGGWVTLWETATLRQLTDLGTSAEPLPSEVTGVAFNHDGSKLAAGGYGAVVIWDVSSEERASLPLSDDELHVQGVAFTRDGRILAASTFDGEVFLWDAASLQPQGTPFRTSYIGVFDLVFSSNGEVLAVAGAGAHLWDVATGQTIGRPLANPAPSEALAVAFRPDGLAIAVAGIVYPWNPSSGVVIWDLDPESWVAVACARARRNLTSDEWKRYLGDDPQRDTCPPASRDAEGSAFATPVVTGVGTPISPAQASPILDLGATATARAAAPLATATAAASLTHRVEGPRPDGSLDHREDDQIEMRYAGVHTHDLSVEAWFFNPYDVQEGTWDYGFAFRDTGDQTYYVVLNSDGTWSFLHRPGDAADNEIATGMVSGLDLTANGSNHLRLVVTSTEALLFVNDNYLATLDISALVAPGDVAVMTGYWAGNEIEGRTTRYEDFTVWEYHAPAEATPVRGRYVKPAVPDHYQQESAA